MPFTSRGPRLEELLTIVDDFAEHAPRRVARGLADEGELLVREGFARSQAPDGTVWRPLKSARARGRRPLLKTYALRDAATAAEVHAGGFTITTTSYGSFHQDGTRRIPARPFFPGRTLPPAWAARMERAGEDALAMPR